jgi:DNA-binding NarL/FixJ family response regulator
VATTRVVLGTLPPLLRDIVRATLTRDADVEIVTQVDGRDEIASALERSEAHVAVLGVAPADWAGLSVFLRALLAAHPRLTIIALASDGRSGYVYRLQPRGVVIDDISPISLAQAIRSIAADEDVHPAIHPLSPE